MPEQIDVDDDWNRHFESQARICKLFSGYEKANTHEKEEIERQIDNRILPQTQEMFWEFYCSYSGPKNILFHLLGQIEDVDLAGPIEGFRLWYLTNRDFSYNLLSGGMGAAAFPFDLLLEHFTSITEGIVSSLIFTLAWENKSRIKQYVKKKWTSLILWLETGYPFENEFIRRGIPKESFETLKKELDKYYSILLIPEKKKSLLGERIGGALVNELEGWHKINPLSVALMKTLTISPKTTTVLSEEIDRDENEVSKILDLLRKHRKLRKIIAKPGKIHWCIWLE